MNSVKLSQILAQVVSKKHAKIHLLQLFATNIQAIEYVFGKEYYKNQYALVSSIITTHTDWQTCHSSFNLNNSGAGCVAISLK
ncbi:unnamed protein product [Paramecium octaurelia]|uniref:Uncharacterized protein n=1 Tax=Paramecium octaurelia TaxID=43137 RepID=A0A8S1T524_PAROT|nr:unnamed protein product [Paramecium octaurelia]